jgi:hypothetical protein
MQQREADCIRQAQGCLSESLARAEYENT